MTPARVWTRRRPTRFARWARVLALAATSALPLHAQSSQPREQISPALEAHASALKRFALRTKNIIMKKIRVGHVVLVAHTPAYSQKVAEELDKVLQTRRIGVIGFENAEGTKESNAQIEKELDDARAKVTALARKGANRDTLDAYAREQAAKIVGRNSFALDIVVRSFVYNIPLRMVETHTPFESYINKAMSRAYALFEAKGKEEVDLSKAQKLFSSGNFWLNASARSRDDDIRRGTFQLHREFKRNGECFIVVGEGHGPAFFPALFSTERIREQRPIFNVNDAPALTGAKMALYVILKEANRKWNEDFGFNDAHAARALDRLPSLTLEEFNRIAAMSKGYARHDLELLIKFELGAE